MSTLVEREKARTIRRLKPRRIRRVGYATTGALTSAGVAMSVFR